MAPSWEVVEVDRGRAEEAVGVLTRALAHYPTMRWVCRSDRPGFEDRLRAIYRVATAMQRVEGQPILGLLYEECLAAAAIVYEPGRKLTPRSALVGLLRGLFSPARSTMKRGQRYEVAIDRLRPRDPHHFLSVIGVCPEVQRRGYGRALMAALHARADRDPRSVGVCLDTCDPDNRRYYETFGYEVIGQCRIGPLDQWVLFRPAA